jgi:hypothetical protein
MKSWAGLGWHWLWFTPLCVVVLCLVEVHVIHFAFATLYLYWQRWTWGAFISPSSDFCLGVTMLSVVFPVSGLIFAAMLKAPETSKFVAHGPAPCPIGARQKRYR